jgi:hypothetical protein
MIRSVAVRDGTAGREAAMGVHDPASRKGHDPMILDAAFACLGRGGLLRRV